MQTAAAFTALAAGLGATLALGLWISARRSALRRRPLGQRLEAAGFVPVAEHALPPSAGWPAGWRWRTAPSLDGACSASTPTLPLALPLRSGDTLVGVVVFETMGKGLEWRAPQPAAAEQGAWVAIDVRLWRSMRPWSRAWSAVGHQALPVVERWSATRGWPARALTLLTHHPARAAPWPGYVLVGPGHPSPEVAGALAPCLISRRSAWCIALHPAGAWVRRQGAAADQSWTELQRVRSALAGQPLTTALPSKVPDPTVM